MSKKQEVINFGCRLNIYEGEIIKKNLEETGYNNIAVINTCTVTKEAERKARQTIRKLKKLDPDRKIIVTGCAAQVNPAIFRDMPEVDKVIGNEEKLVASNYYLDGNRVLVNDIMSVKETASHLIAGFEGRARAFIQVQNGCDHNCTFCIIPSGRGRSRSVPIGEIVAQIRLLLNNGYHEIVFTGVDLTAYGQDLPGSPSFAQMIRRVLALIPELKRLRLSSIDVAEIDSELFEIMATEARLMPHFHISLQSGDDMILIRMKRRHRRQQVVDFCHKLRAVRPETAFGADIIAGFPTETDAMFENTKNLISEAGLQYLHIFPFSARAGTPAARMPQVRLDVRKERAAILRTEGEKELQKFYNANIGKHVTLLAEHNNVAYTENFIPVILEPNQFAAGSLIKATLTAINEQSSMMLCEIISPQPDHR